VQPLSPKKGKERLFERKQCHIAAHPWPTRNRMARTLRAAPLKICTAALCKGYVICIHMENKCLVICIIHSEKSIHWALLGRKIGKFQR